MQNEELLFKDLIYAFLNYKFEILSYRFVLLHIFLLICLWIYWYTFWNIKSCKRYRCCLGNVYEYIDNTRSGGMSLCVGRCTTRKKLNKGVTWSISLNLWSICIYKSKTKSICEPFFDLIKITDFLIAKLIIFWEWKMTPKNSQFCYKKSVILIQSKKGSHIDFVFDA